MQLHDYADLKYYSKIGWRPMYSERHDERNFYVKLQNGYDEDEVLKPNSKSKGTIIF